MDKATSSHYTGLLMALLVGLATCSLHGQQSRPIGTWRTYLSSKESIAILHRDDEIWTTTKGGLLRLDRVSGELTSISTIEGLSDISSTAMTYLPSTDQIILGYGDGRIDYFTDPSDIQVLTDIQRSTTFPDKRINDFAADANRLYVATNFGLQVFRIDGLLPIVDVAQFGTNPINVPVIEVAVFDGRIYVLLETSKIFSISASSPNLRDPSGWLAEPDISNLLPSDTIRSIGATNFGLFALLPNSVIQKQADEWVELESLAKGWGFLHTQPDAMSVSGLGNVVLMTEAGETFESLIPATVVDLTYLGGGTYYQATEFDGIFDSGGNQIVKEGPPDNQSVRISAGNGELYIAPLGYDQSFIPLSTGRGVYYYNSQGDAWKHINITNELTPEVDESFVRSYYDLTTGRAYLGSWLGGISVLENGTLTDAYTCLNSTLNLYAGSCQEGRNNSTRVSGLDVDLNGNLWVSMYIGEPPLTVRDATGVWHELPQLGYPSSFRAADMVVDSYGTAWIVEFNRGLWAYTSNGTPDIFDDGRLLRFGSDQNAGNLPTDQILSVAEDLDGFIWVGTSEGATVIFDPFTVSQGQVVAANQPIIPNGDESALLLSNTEVNAIAVDGGNRKWFATTDGLYLVSPDGDQVITQFTQENSPLLSNLVRDVAIDQVTGEIFAATDRGVISYQGDAVAGAANCSEITVYPNPVFTDYDGPIVVRGMVADSRVKITTISGMLVRELTAFGGQATWDGRDNRGQRVRSGVYLAMVADNAGENDCVGKFVVISRGQRP